VISAAGGVRGVWAVNLPERVLEVDRDAGPAGYRDRRSHRPGERAAPPAFPEPALAVADLLPPGSPEREPAREAESPPERGRRRGPER
jgi:hypothetical protein